MLHVLTLMLSGSCTLQTVGWDAATLAALRARVANGTLPAAQTAAVAALRQSAEQALSLPSTRKLCPARRGPWTVTAQAATPPSGDKHDLMSFGTYLWPCNEACNATLFPPSGHPNCTQWAPPAPGGCDTATGLPWISRDGFHNYAGVEDEECGIAMSDCVRTLALAGYALSNSSFSARAADVVRAWFVAPATAMNPSLQYAAIKPVAAAGGAALNGSSGGIIFASDRWNSELGDAVELIRAAQDLQQQQQDLQQQQEEEEEEEEKGGERRRHLNGSSPSPARGGGGGAPPAAVFWGDGERVAWKAWNIRLLLWLTGSPHGAHEGNATNNHATWYWTLALAIATGNATGGGEARSAALRETLAARLRAGAPGSLGQQIEASGQMPRETARADGASYSAMNVRALFHLANVADKTVAGAGLFDWHYGSGSGSGGGGSGGTGSMRRALDFLLPFATNASAAWPYGQLSADTAGAWRGLAPQLRQAAIRSGDARYEEAIARLPWAEGDWPRKWQADVAQLLWPWPAASAAAAD
jgi:hypothetical protein